MSGGDNPPTAGDGRRCLYKPAGGARDQGGWGFGVLYNIWDKTMDFLLQLL